MKESSRRDFLGGIAATAAASVAGCQSEERDRLSEVINNIEYRQRDLIESYNKREGSQIESIFEEDSMELGHKPENIDQTSGKIDYIIDARTAQEGPLADMEDMHKETEKHTSKLLGSLMLAQFQVPILGTQGDGFKDKETHEEYRKRLGSMGAQIKDYEGNTATLEMPEADVEDYWDQVENTLEQDTDEAKRETLQDLRGYCEENIEYSY